MKISVTVLTKNSEKYLERVLEALKTFDEVVLFDTGSSDHTFAIAAKFPNVSLHKALFDGFGKTHNKASSAARNDWILSIDSDEVATPALVQEIVALQLDEATVYSMPRQNFYRGKWIRGCGWWPDRQFRLYNRQKTRFSDAEVHESILREGLQHVALQAPLQHYSYDSISDFLSKMQSYSDLFAKQNKGKKSSLCKAVLHGLFTFFKSYILKRGFLDGKEGFIISVYNADTAFYKYAKLAEASPDKG